MKINILLYDIINYRIIFNLYNNCRDMDHRYRVALCTEMCFVSISMHYMAS